MSAINQRVPSPEKLGDAAYAGAEAAENLIASEMFDGKSGIQYSNLPNRSSSPTETPAVQSGELVERMEARRLPSTPTGGRAELVAEGKHAWWMELGWMGSGGIFHIRPFMRPGIAKHRAHIASVMQAVLRR